MAGSSSMEHERRYQRADRDKKIPQRESQLSQPGPGQLRPQIFDSRCNTQNQEDISSNQMRPMPIIAPVGMVDISIMVNRLHGHFDNSNGLKTARADKPQFRSQICQLTEMNDQDIFET
jgi:hypothetical protein